MSKKHHHMTKHQYNTYKKHHRQDKHTGGEDDREGRAQSSKYREISDTHMLKLLRSAQGHSDDFLDEEYDDISSQA